VRKKNFHLNKNLSRKWEFWWIWRPEKEAKIESSRPK